MNQYLEITNMSCPACGASVVIDSEEKKCDCCNTELKILKPINIIQNKDLSIPDSDKTKYVNMIKILENALVAGNYKESY